VGEVVVRVEMLVTVEVVVEVTVVVAKAHGGVA
jgi:hypothetical protein